MEYKLSEQELKDLMHRTWLQSKKFYSGKTDEYFYDYFKSEKKQLPIHVVSKRYQVTDIQLADLESVAIGDTETNKVVCHFFTENGFDEAVKMANKIADYLNVC